jgi:hypothetical protein
MSEPLPAAAPAHPGLPLNILTDLGIRVGGEVRAMPHTGLVSVREATKLLRANRGGD